MRIFISYRSTDRQPVTDLAQDLTDLGYSEVWFDRELSGGQMWWDSILENIRACELFIFALTPASLESEPCRQEYQYATQLNKHVLPILLSDGVNVPLLPPELQAIQYVDYRQRDRKSLSQLSRALVRLPDPQKMPEPLPEPPSVPISPLAEIKAVIDSDTIPSQMQASLILDLKAYLDDDRLKQDARALLQELRRHRDLRASRASEIDAILELPVVTPQPQPSPPVQSQRQWPAMPGFTSVFWLLMTYGIIVGAWVVGGFMTEELLMARSYSEFRFKTLLLAYITVGGAGTSFMLIHAGKGLDSWRWRLLGAFTWPVSLYVIVQFIDAAFEFQDFRRFYPNGYDTLYHMTRNAAELPHPFIIVAIAMGVTSVILRRQGRLETLRQQIALVVGWVVIVFVAGQIGDERLLNLLMPTEAFLIGVTGGAFSLWLVNRPKKNTLAT